MCRRCVCTLYVAVTMYIYIYICMAYTYISPVYTVCFCAIHAIFVIALVWLCGMFSGHVALRVCTKALAHSSKWNSSITYSNNVYT